MHMASQQCHQVTETHHGLCNANVLTRGLGKYLQVTFFLVFFQDYCLANTNDCCSLRQNSSSSSALTLLEHWWANTVLPQRSPQNNAEIKLWMLLYFGTTDQFQSESIRRTAYNTCGILHSPSAWHTGLTTSEADTGTEYHESPT